MTQAATCRTWGHGKRTQTAGTKINVLMPPVKKKRSKLTYFGVTTLATAHVLTVLRPLQKVFFSAAAAAAQTTIVLTKDPGSYVGKRTANNLIASGDFVVYKCYDGTYVIDLINGTPTTNSDGTVTAVLTANVPTLGVRAGDPVWFMGVSTDTDPNSENAEAHPFFALYASSLNTERSSEGSLVETINQYEPLLMQIDNGSNASVVESMQGVYGP